MGKCSSKERVGNKVVSKINAVQKAAAAAGGSETTSETKKTKEPSSSQTSPVPVVAKPTKVPSPLPSPSPSPSSASVLSRNLSKGSVSERYHDAQEELPEFPALDPQGNLTEEHKVETSRKAESSKLKEPLESIREKPGSSKEQSGSGKEPAPAASSPGKSTRKPAPSQPKPSENPVVSTESATKTRSPPTRAQGKPVTSVKPSSTPVAKPASVVQKPVVSDSKPKPVVSDYKPKPDARPKPASAKAPLADTSKATADAKAVKSSKLSVPKASSPETKPSAKVEVPVKADSSPKLRGVVEVPDKTGASQTSRKIVDAASASVEVATVPKVAARKEVKAKDEATEENIPTTTKGSRATKPQEKQKQEFQVAVTPREAYKAERTIESPVIGLVERPGPTSTLGLEQSKGRETGPEVSFEASKSSVRPDVGWDSGGGKQAGIYSFDDKKAKQEQVLKPMELETVHDVITPSRVQDDKAKKPHDCEPQTDITVQASCVPTTGNVVKSVDDTPQESVRRLYKVSLPKEEAVVSKEVQKVEADEDTWEIITAAETNQSEEKTAKPSFGIHPIQQAEELVTVERLVEHSGKVEPATVIVKPRPEVKEVQPSQLPQGDLLIEEEVADLTIQEPVSGVQEKLNVLPSVFSSTVQTVRREVEPLIYVQAPELKKHSVEVSKLDKEEQLVQETIEEPVLDARNVGANEVEPVGDGVHEIAELDIPDAQEVDVTASVEWKPAVVDAQEKNIEATTVAIHIEAAKIATDAPEKTADAQDAAELGESSAKPAEAVQPPEDVTEPEVTQKVEDQLVRDIKIAGLAKTDLQNVQLASDTRELQPVQATDGGNVENDVVDAEADAGSKKADAQEADAQKVDLVPDAHEVESAYALQPEVELGSVPTVDHGVKSEEPEVVEPAKDAQEVLIVGPATDAQEIDQEDDGETEIVEPLRAQDTEILGAAANAQAGQTEGIGYEGAEILDPFEDASEIEPAESGEPEVKEIVADAQTAADAHNGQLLEARGDVHQAEAVAEPEAQEIQEQMTEEVPEPAGEIEVVDSLDVQVVKPKELRGVQEEVNVAMAAHEPEAVGLNDDGTEVEANSGEIEVLEPIVEPELTEASYQELVAEPTEIVNQGAYALRVKHAQEKDFGGTKVPEDAADVQADGEVVLEPATDTHKKVKVAEPAVATLEAQQSEVAAQETRFAEESDTEDTIQLQDVKIAAYTSAETTNAHDIEEGANVIAEPEVGQVHLEDQESEPDVSVGVIKVLEDHFGGHVAPEELSSEIQLQERSLPSERLETVAAAPDKQLSSENFNEMVLDDLVGSSAQLTGGAQSNVDKAGQGVSALQSPEAPDVLEPSEVSGVIDTSEVMPSQDIDAVHVPAANIVHEPPSVAAVEEHDEKASIETSEMKESADGSYNVSSIEIEPIMESAEPVTQVDTVQYRPTASHFELPPFVKAPEQIQSPLGGNTSVDAHATDYVMHMLPIMPAMIIGEAFEMSREVNPSNEGLPKEEDFSVVETVGIPEEGIHAPSPETTTKVPITTDTDCTTTAKQVVEPEVSLVEKAEVPEQLQDPLSSIEVLHSEAEATVVVNELSLELPNQVQVSEEETAEEVGRKDEHSIETLESTENEQVLQHEILENAAASKTAEGNDEILEDPELGAAETIEVEASGLHVAAEKLVNEIDVPEIIDQAVDGVHLVAPVQDVEQTDNTRELIIPPSSESTEVPPASFQPDAEDAHNEETDLHEQAVGAKTIEETSRPSEERTSLIALKNLGVKPIDEAEPMGNPSTEQAVKDKTKTVDRKPEQQGPTISEQAIREVETSTEARDKPDDLMTEELASSIQPEQESSLPEEIQIEKCEEPAASVEDPEIAFTHKLVQKQKNQDEVYEVVVTTQGKKGSDHTEQAELLLGNVENATKTGKSELEKESEQQVKEAEQEEGLDVPPAERNETLVTDSVQLIPETQEGIIQDTSEGPSVDKKQFDRELWEAAQSVEIPSEKVAAEIEDKPAEAVVPPALTDEMDAEPLPEVNEPAEVKTKDEPVKPEELSLENIPGSLKEEADTQIPAEPHEAQEDNEAALVRSGDAPEKEPIGQLASTVEDLEVAPDTKVSDSPVKQVTTEVSLVDQALNAITKDDLEEALNATENATAEVPPDQSLPLVEESAKEGDVSSIQVEQKNPSVDVEESGVDVLEEQVTPFEEATYSQTEEMAKAQFLQHTYDSDVTSVLPTGRSISESEAQENAQVEAPAAETKEDSQVIHETKQVDEVQEQFQKVEITTGQAEATQVQKVRVVDEEEHAPLVKMDIGLPVALLKKEHIREVPTTAGTTADAQVETPVADIQADAQDSLVNARGAFNDGEARITAVPEEEVEVKVEPRVQLLLENVEDPVQTEESGSMSSELVDANAEADHPFEESSVLAQQECPDKVPEQPAKASESPDAKAEFEDVQVAIQRAAVKAEDLSDEPSFEDKKHAKAETVVPAPIFSEKSTSDFTKMVQQDGNIEIIDQTVLADSATTEVQEPSANIPEVKVLVAPDTQVSDFPVDDTEVKQALNLITEEDLVKEYLNATKNAKVPPLLEEGEMSSIHEFASADVEESGVKEEKALPFEETTDPQIDKMAEAQFIQRTYDSDVTIIKPTGGIISESEAQEDAQVEAPIGETKEDSQVIHEAEQVDEVQEQVKKNEITTGEAETIQFKEPSNVQKVEERAPSVKMDIGMPVEDQALLKKEHIDEESMPVVTTAGSIEEAETAANAQVEAPVACAQADAQVEDSNFKNGETLGTGDPTDPEEEVEVNLEPRGHIPEVQLLSEGMEDLEESGGQSSELVDADADADADADVQAEESSVLAQQEWPDEVPEQPAEAFESPDAKVEFEDVQVDKQGAAVKTEVLSNEPNFEDTKDAKAKAGVPSEGDRVLERAVDIQDTLNTATENQEAEETNIVVEAQEVKYVEGEAIQAAEQMQATTVQNPDLQLEAETSQVPTQELVELAVELQAEGSVEVDRQEPVIQPGASDSDQNVERGVNGFKLSDTQEVVEQEATKLEPLEHAVVLETVHIPETIIKQKIEPNAKAVVDDTNAAEEQKVATENEIDRSVDILVQEINSVDLVASEASIPSIEGAADDFPVFMTQEADSKNGDVKDLQYAVDTQEVNSVSIPESGLQSPLSLEDKGDSPCETVEVDEDDRIVGITQKATVVFKEAHQVNDHESMVSPQYEATLDIEEAIATFEDDSLVSISQDGQGVVEEGDVASREVAKGESAVVTLESKDEPIDMAGGESAVSFAAEEAPVTFEDKDKPVQVNEDETAVSVEDHQVVVERQVVNTEGYEYLDEKPAQAEILEPETLQKKPVLNEGNVEAQEVEPGDVHKIKVVEFAADAQVEAARQLGIPDDAQELESKVHMAGGDSAVKPIAIQIEAANISQDMEELANAKLVGESSAKAMQPAEEVTEPEVGPGQVKGTEKVEDQPVEPDVSVQETGFPNAEHIENIQAAPHAYLAIDMRELKPVQAPGNAVAAADASKNEVESLADEDALVLDVHKVESESPSDVPELEVELGSVLGVDHGVESEEPELDAKEVLTLGPSIEIDREEDAEVDSTGVQDIEILEGATNAQAGQKEGIQEPEILDPLIDSQKQKGIEPVRYGEPEVTDIVVDAQTAANAQNRELLEAETAKIFQAKPETDIAEPEVQEIQEQVTEKKTLVPAVDIDFVYPQQPETLEMDDGTKAEAENSQESAVMEHTFTEATTYQELGSEPEAEIAELIADLETAERVKSAQEKDVSGIKVLEDAADAREAEVLEPAADDHEAEPKVADTHEAEPKVEVAELLKTEPVAALEVQPSEDAAQKTETAEESDPRNAEVALDAIEREAETAETADAKDGKEDAGEIPVPDVSESTAEVGEAGDKESEPNDSIGEIEILEDHGNADHIEGQPAAPEEENKTSDASSVLHSETSEDVLWPLKEAADTQIGSDPHKAQKDNEAAMVRSGAEEEPIPEPITQLESEKPTVKDLEVAPDTDSPVEQTTMEVEQALDSLVAEVKQALNYITEEDLMEKAPAKVPLDIDAEAQEEHALLVEMDLSMPVEDQALLKQEHSREETTLTAGAADGQVEAPVADTQTDAQGYDSLVNARGIVNDGEALTNGAPEEEFEIIVEPAEHVQPLSDTVEDLDLSGSSELVAEADVQADHPFEEEIPVLAQEKKQDEVPEQPATKTEFEDVQVFIQRAAVSDKPNFEATEDAKAGVDVLERALGIADTNTVEENQQTEETHIAIQAQEVKPVEEKTIQAAEQTQATNSQDPDVQFQAEAVKDTQEPIELAAEIQAKGILEVVIPPGANESDQGVDQALNGLKLSEQPAYTQEQEATKLEPPEHAVVFGETVDIPENIIEQTEKLEFDIQDTVSKDPETSKAPEIGKGEVPNAKALNDTNAAEYREVTTEYELDKADKTVDVPVQEIQRAADIREQQISPSIEWGAEDFPVPEADSKYGTVTTPESGEETLQAPLGLKDKGEPSETVQVNEEEKSVGTKDITEPTAAIEETVILVNEVQANKDKSAVSPQYEASISKEGDVEDVPATSGNKDESAGDESAVSFAEVETAPVTLEDKDEPIQVNEDKSVDSVEVVQRQVVDTERYDESPAHDENFEPDTLEFVLYPQDVKVLEEPVLDSRKVVGAQEVESVQVGLEVHEIDVLEPPAADEKENAEYIENLQAAPTAGNVQLASDTRELEPFQATDGGSSKEDVVVQAAADPRSKKDGGQADAQKVDLVPDVHEVESESPADAPELEVELGNVPSLDHGVEPKVVKPAKDAQEVQTVAQEEDGEAVIVELLHIQHIESLEAAANAQLGQTKGIDYAEAAEILDHTQENKEIEPEVEEVLADAQTVEPAADDQKATADVIQAEPDTEIEEAEVQGIREEVTKRETVEPAENIEVVDFQEAEAEAVELDDVEAENPRVLERTFEPEVTKFTPYQELVAEPTTDAQEAELQASVLYQAAYALEAESEAKIAEPVADSDTAKRAQEKDVRGIDVQEHAADGQASREAEVLEPAADTHEAEPKVEVAELLETEPVAALEVQSSKVAAQETELAEESDPRNTEVAPDVIDCEEITIEMVQQNGETKVVDQTVLTLQLSEEVQESLANIQVSEAASTEPSGGGESNVEVEQGVSTLQSQEAPYVLEPSEVSGFIDTNEVMHSEDSSSIAELLDVVHEPATNMRPSVAAVEEQDEQASFETSESAEGSSSLSSNIEVEPIAEEAFAVVKVDAHATYDVVIEQPEFGEFVEMSSKVNASNEGLQVVAKEEHSSAAQSVDIEEEEICVSSPEATTEVPITTDTDSTQVEEITTAKNLVEPEDTLVEKTVPEQLPSDPLRAEDSIEVLQQWDAQPEDEATEAVHERSMEGLQLRNQVQVSEEETVKEVYREDEHQIETLEVAENTENEQVLQNKIPENAKTSKTVEANYAISEHSEPEAEETTEVEATEKLVNELDVPEIVNQTVDGVDLFVEQTDTILSPSSEGSTEVPPASFQPEAKDAQDEETDAHEQAVDAETIEETSQTLEERTLLTALENLELKEEAGQRIQQNTEQAVEVYEVQQTKPVDPRVPEQEQDREVEVVEKPDYLMTKGLESSVQPDAEMQQLPNQLLVLDQLSSDKVAENVEAEPAMEVRTEERAASAEDSEIVFPQEPLQKQENQDEVLDEVGLNTQGQKGSDHTEQAERLVDNATETRKSDLEEQVKEADCLEEKEAECEADSGVDVPAAERNETLVADAVQIIPETQEGPSTNKKKLVRELWESVTVEQEPVEIPSEEVALVENEEKPAKAVVPPALIDEKQMDAEPLIASKFNEPAEVKTIGEPVEPEELKETNQNAAEKDVPGTLEEEAETQLSAEPHEAQEDSEAAMVQSCDVVEPIGKLASDEPMGKELVVAPNISDSPGEQATTNEYSVKQTLNVITKDDSVEEATENAPAEFPLDIADGEAQEEQALLVEIDIGMPEAVLKKEDCPEETMLTAGSIEDAETAADAQVAPVSDTQADVQVADSLAQGIVNDGEALTTGVPEINVVHIPEVQLLPETIEDPVQMDKSGGQSYELVDADAEADVQADHPLEESTVLARPDEVPERPVEAFESADAKVELEVVQVDKQGVAVKAEDLSDEPIYEDTKDAKAEAGVPSEGDQVLERAVNIPDTVNTVKEIQEAEETNIAVEEKAIQVAQATKSQEADVQLQAEANEVPVKDTQGPVELASKEVNSVTNLDIPYQTVQAPFSLKENGEPGETVQVDDNGSLFFQDDAKVTLVDQVEANEDESVVSTQYEATVHIEEATATFEDNAQVVGDDIDSEVSIGDQGVAEEGDVEEALVTYGDKDEPVHLDGDESGVPFEAEVEEAPATLEEKDEPIQDENVVKDKQGVVVDTEGYEYLEEPPLQAEKIESETVKFVPDPQDVKDVQEILEEPVLDAGNVEAQEGEPVQVHEIVVVEPAADVQEVEAARQLGIPDDAQEVDVTASVEGKPAIDGQEENIEATLAAKTADAQDVLVGELSAKATEVMQPPQEAEIGPAQVEGTEKCEDKQIEPEVSVREMAVAKHIEDLAQDAGNDQLASDTEPLQATNGRNVEEDVIVEPAAHAGKVGRLEHPADVQEADAQEADAQEDDALEQEADAQKVDIVADVHEVESESPEDVPEPDVELGSVLAVDHGVEARVVEPAKDAQEVEIVGPATEDGEAETVKPLSVQDTEILEAVANAQEGQAEGIEYAQGAEGAEILDPDTQEQKEIEPVESGEAAADAQNRELLEAATADVHKAEPETEPEVQEIQELVTEEETSICPAGSTAVDFQEAEPALDVQVVKPEELSGVNTGIDAHEPEAVELDDGIEVEAENSLEIGVLERTFEPEVTEAPQYQELVAEPTAHVQEAELQASATEVMYEALETEQASAEAEIAEPVKSSQEKNVGSLNVADTEVKVWEPAVDTHEAVASLEVQQSEVAAQETEPAEESDPEVAWDGLQYKAVKIATDTSAETADGQDGADTSAETADGQDFEDDAVEISVAESIADICEAVEPSQATTQLEVEVSEPEIGHVHLEDTQTSEAQEDKPVSVGEIEDLEDHGNAEHIEGQHAAPEERDERPSTASIVKKAELPSEIPFREKLLPSELLETVVVAAPQKSTNDLNEIVQQDGEIELIDQTVLADCATEVPEVKVLVAPDTQVSNFPVDDTEVKQALNLITEEDLVKEYLNATKNAKVPPLLEQGEISSIHEFASADVEESGVKEEKALPFEETTDPQIDKMAEAQFLYDSDVTTVLPTGEIISKSEAQEDAQVEAPIAEDSQVIHEAEQVDEVQEQVKIDEITTGPSNVQKVEERAPLVKMEIGMPVEDQALLKKELIDEETMPVVTTAGSIEEAETAANAQVEAPVACAPADAQVEDSNFKNGETLGTGDPTDPEEEVEVNLEPRGHIPEVQLLLEGMEDLEESGGQSSELVDADAEADVQAEESSVLAQQEWPDEVPEQPAEAFESPDAKVEFEDVQVDKQGAAVKTEVLSNEPNFEDTKDPKAEASELERDIADTVEENQETEVTHIAVEAQEEKPVEEEAIQAAERTQATKSQEPDILEAEASEVSLKLPEHTREVAEQPPLNLEDKDEPSETVQVDKGKNSVLFLAGTTQDVSKAINEVTLVDEVQANKASPQSLDIDEETATFEGKAQVVEDDSVFSVGQVGQGVAEEGDVEEAPVTSGDKDERVHMAKGESAV